ncbi:MAG TPA: DnaA regulatory inactivator Hda [Casimicrobiaceae bacterium]
MEQLVFELALPEPPRLSNFLPGRNRELVAALTRLASGAGGERGLLIWGASGAGKTHLLRAAVALAAEHSIDARFHGQPAALLADPADTSAMLVAIDRIDEADAAAAASIFTRYNALTQRGGRLLAASRMPLATLPLREDLRTRLAWGLVYEALPLADEEKPAALTTYARQRGFELSAEVIDYLLRHGRRDMGSLVAAVAALDRLSLAAKRPITIPLLREWLQAALDWERR